MKACVCLYVCAMCVPVYVYVLVSVYLFLLIRMTVIFRHYVNTDDVTKKQQQKTVRIIS